MHTLKSLATLLAELDYRSDEAEQIHAQLRNLHAKGLIAVKREVGYGKTAAGRVSNLEAARARILTTLIDIGFDASTHRDVNAALDRPISYFGQPPKSATVDGAIVSEGALRDVLRGVASDEDWQLRIDLFRHMSGERELSVWLNWPGLADYPRQTSDTINSFYGRRPLATVTLPLSSLLASFVEER